MRIAAHQEATQEWWETKRHEYDLYISDLVLDEVSEGDAELASLRIAALAGITTLDVIEEVDELATRLLAGGLIPARRMPFMSPCPQCMKWISCSLGTAPTSIT